jgi:hypothetical protein
VLSAEEASPANAVQVRAGVNEALATANGFSPEDLTANRNGQTTPAQRSKLRWNAFSGTVLAVIALTVLFPVVLSLLFPGTKTALPSLFLILIAAFFLLIGSSMVVNALIDMFISTPQQTQGPGHKEKRTHRRTLYYYVIGGRGFEIGYGPYLALIDGLDYRVYFLPRTKRLIAIEALDSSVF